MLFAQRLRIRKELKAIRQGPHAVPDKDMSGRRFPLTISPKSFTNPSPFAHRIQHCSKFVRETFPLFLRDV